METCYFLRKWRDCAHVLKEKGKDVRDEWGRGFLGRKYARKGRSLRRFNRKKKELLKQKNTDFLPYFKGPQLFQLQEIYIKTEKNCFSTLR